MKQLVFTDQAEADLEAISDYIALDSPFRAVTFIQEQPISSRHVHSGIAPRLRGVAHHAGTVSAL